VRVRRAPWSLLLLAAALRALVCIRTAVPGRDGATYLWMAERAAAGDFGALFQTVFHPLYPALVGALLKTAPGLDPVVAGQVVACGLGAIAVVPLWAVARALFGERAAFWCGFAYATGAWFARTPAECMSEGPFYLGVAIWAHALLGGRVLLAGAASAFAYLARPEGMALAAIGSAWLLARGERRNAALALAAALLLGALLPLGYAAFGDGWTLTPKAAFNYEVGVGGSPAPVLRYLREAAGLPTAALEDLGWLWFPLMVAGAWRFRPRHWRDGAVPLLLPFLAQCAVVPLLQSHQRFLSGFGALLCAFGGALVPQLLDAARRRHRAGPLLVVLALVASEARIAGARNQDRAIERELGRTLRAHLRPGEVVVSDMPRLDYFAGQKPPPPRPILPEDLLARAADPACRYVVLVERQPESGAGPPRRRTAVDLARLRQLGLEPLSAGSLPSAPSPTSDVLIFERPRTR
jgi:hypothetical protein